MSFKDRVLNEGKQKIGLAMQIGAVADIHSPKYFDLFKETLANLDQCDLFFSRALRFVGPAHSENESIFDPYDPESMEANLKMMEKTNKALTEENISSPTWSISQVALSKGLDPWDEIARAFESDPRPWMRKIKQKFDPNDASHGMLYIAGPKEGSEK